MTVSVKLSNKQSTILVTGASGFIGSRLAALAIAQGYLVKTLSRSTETISEIISPEHRYAGNFPADIPAAALENVDVVVHCAAWVQSDPRIAQAVNVDGTLRLAEIAVQCKVGTFIFLSSQSASPDATSEYGRSKYAAEQALLAKFSNKGLCIIILRPGLVTGFGHQGVYQRLCRIVDSWPILPLLNGGKSIVQPIHIEDLCYAIVRSWENSHQFNGKIFNLGHTQGVTLNEFLQDLSFARKGYHKLIVRIPLAPIAYVVRAAEYFHISLPITTENLKGLKQVQKMETQTDMALLDLPLRSIQMILRDYLGYDASVLREGILISHYLVQRRPSSELLLRYADAVQRWKITLDRDEARLWRIIERYPGTLRMIDGGLAFLKPHGGIRKRVYTMLAILEASSEYSEYFLPKPCSHLHAARLIGIGIRACLATLLGLVIIQLVKARSN